MGTDLTTNIGHTLDRRPSRAVNRQLNELDRSSMLALARIDAQTDLVARRMASLGYLTKAALLEVTFIGEAEAKFAQLSPINARRLEAVADIGALTIAETLADAPRRLA